ncbi:hypothetical protein GCM10027085_17550 [Spirosoma aerophilum]
MQIAFFYRIAINDAQYANARSHQVLTDGATQTTRPDQRYAGLFESLLTGQPNLGQPDVAAVAV